MQINVEDDIPLHVDVIPNVVEVATPSVERERENQVTNKNRLSLIKDKKALEKDITDKDFLISSQKEVIENMRAKFEAVSESSAITADELGEKLKAVEEERNSLIKMIKSKDQNIDELSVAIESLGKKQTNQEDGDNSELHALREQYDVAYRESTKREELLLQARTSLKNANGELEVLSGKLKNAEIELHLKDGLADLQKKEIASLQDELQKKELEKRVSSELAETLPTETGDLSKQLVTLRAKCKQDLADKQLLLTKTELVVKTKDELLEAKQEIVENLKFRIGILQTEKKNEKNGQSDLTSNTKSPVDEVTDVLTCANGVDDACEFIKVYAKSGVVMNGFLMWANIQRLTTPENEWKEEALKKFLKSEITDAKECLWRICGEKITLPLKKRQGSSKSVSEVDDIAKALKILAENENLPMFIATADMVKETPIFLQAEKVSENEREMMSKLKCVENSLKEILTQNKAAEEGHKLVNVNPGNGDSDNKNSIQTARVTWADEEDIVLSEPEDHSAEEEWSVVGEKSKEKRRTWKDKLNILKGTLSNDNNDAPQPADVHLVAYGFGTDTSGEQLKQWLRGNGIVVKSCSLLTTFEGARSHTFKLVVKSTDYEKATNPAIWPENVGVRKFRFFGSKKRSYGNGDKNNNKKSSPDPEVIIHPERPANGNQSKRHPSYPKRADLTGMERETNRIWNSPSKDLLMQYQKRFGPIGPGGNPPLQSQNIWYPPQAWKAQQTNHNVQNDQLQQIHPQVTILRRNGNTPGPSQFSQEMMTDDDYDWSLDYNAYQ